MSTTWTNAAPWAHMTVTQMDRTLHGEDGIVTRKMESARLTMRPREAGDTLTISAMVMDHARMELFWPHPMNEYQALEWLGQRDCWVFRAKESREVVFLGVTEPKDEHGNMVVHGIAAPSSGLGGPALSLEAFRLGAAVCFDRLGARRLVASPLEGNRAACRLLERAGFRKEGVMLEAVYVAGRYRNVYLYAKLKGE